MGELQVNESPRDWLCVFAKDHQYVIVINVPQKDVAHPVLRLEVVYLETFTDCE